MAKQNLVPLLAASTMLLGSCASILNSGKQSMTLDSEPSGAMVYVNGNERGTTPFNYTYHPDDGKEVAFELRRTGYRTTSVTLRPGRSNGVLFVDAMLLHIPYIVDAKSPALYKMPIKEYTVNLYREAPTEMTRYMLPVTGMGTDVATRDALGTLKGKPMKLDKDSPFRDLNQVEVLTSAVTNGLKDTWLDARVVRTGTTKGDEAVQRAKVHLRPQIKSMHATLTGDRVRCFGPVTLEMEWRFYSGLRSDSVLFSMPQRVVYHVPGERATDIVSAAVTHAARLLAEDTGLPARMAEHYGAGLAMSKGGTVAIGRPKPIAFNSRKEMIPALVKAVVTVQTDKGHGSGFLISNDGYLITNEHVVGKEAVVKVKFEQGFTLDAQVIKTNKDFDVALLKVQATDMPALTIGNDAGLSLGEEIFAIGTPMDAALGQSVSRGVLSGRRELEGRVFLQTDVSINPGNSGGPLLDEDGKVVGVATMKISGRGLEGLGFGVPISVALEMLNINMDR